MYTRPDEIRMLVEGFTRGYTIIARVNGTAGTTRFTISNGSDKLQLLLDINVTTIYWTQDRLTRSRVFDLFDPESTRDIREHIQAVLPENSTRVMHRGAINEEK
jgi:hypothetical protein